jgi:hypothetical protein
MVPSGDVAAARQVLEATDLANPETLSDLEAVRFTQAGQDAARALLASGASGDALWAATWIYATSGTDPSVLAPVLADEDPTIRALAAAALLSWGRPEAAAVLRDLLSATGHLRGGAPPLLISEFAAYSLGRSIEGPTIDAAATPADVTTAWTSWLAANESSMQFVAETGKWGAR